MIQHGALRSFCSKFLLNSLKAYSNSFKLLGIAKRISSSKFCTMEKAGNSMIDAPRTLKNPLVWIDLEMSGLNVETDKILEFACLLSDGQLENVKEGPSYVIHQSDDVLDNMNEWCTNQHSKTGLTESCRKSTVSEADAEKWVMEFLEENGIKQGEARLAGNTVYMDRLFLAKYMPKIDQHLHYRIVDVSSVKELCKYWYPSKFYQAPNKEGNHRAMEDIYASLKELKYYREKIFV
ncbi:oligoribonuclease isoform X2 [Neocloeon triangulifer]|uniref:oligoribonuclease isoform X2 n=1 Tax=Neocloeon triangulifer TaxID=2078957 RepID=UPI00286EB79F|nr:oligoribonuclease isoform X2 [Neocloeon triangulifer]